MASFPWNYNSNVSAEIEGQIKVIEALNKAEIRAIQARSNARQSEMMLKSITDDVSASSKYWRENMNTHITNHGSTHHDICHQPGNYQSNDTW